MDQIKFKFNGEELSNFISVLADLSKISVTVKLKIVDDKLLIYSIDTAGSGATAGQSSALAFKTYSFPLETFFDVKDYNDDSYNVDWIIKNVKILNKKLNFFENEEIKGVFKLKKSIKEEEIKYARSVVWSDSKFKFSLSGDESHVIKDISFNQLNTILDPTLSELSFNVPSVEFEKARKATEIEPEDTVTIELREGSIYFTQPTWEMLVGKIDSDEKRKISFHKKYLKSINPKVEEANFSIFPTFLLYQEGNQKLMVSFEQNF